jgi:membrane AbrB-like protein
MPSALRPLIVTLAAFALALTSGGVAKLAGIPAPWLLGAVVGSLLLGALRRRPNFPEPVRWLAFIMLGYLIGSTASATFLGSLSLWLPSLVVMAVLIPLVTFVSAAVMLRLSDLSTEEAVLCSLPGALPFAIAASENLGLRSEVVAMYQSLRLLSLTLILPFVVMIIPQEALTQTAATPLDAGVPGLFSWVLRVPPTVLIPLSLLVGAGCAALAALARIPGALFIGPMAGISVLKIIGVPLPNLPELVLIVSQAALGWLMGTRFDAIPMRRFASLALACFCGLAAGVAVVIVAGLGLISLTSLPARELVLALAPGAIETTTAIALDRDLDALFVSTHQIARMLIIPLMALSLLAVGRALFKRRQAGAEDR